MVEKIQSNAAAQSVAYSSSITGQFRRNREWGRKVGVLATIAAGGALGSTARYGMAVAIPRPVDAFPWSTFVVNCIGCFLIGLLMVFLTEMWTTAHRSIRLFCGVGVLGGFTTFSTYANDVRSLLDAGEVLTGFAYLLGTAAGALFAVWLAAVLARLTIEAIRQFRIRHEREAER